MSSEVYSFRGVAAKYETYERIGLDPSANIAIHFDRFQEAVFPGTLKPFPGPALRGVSGGAIFSWPKQHSFRDDWSTHLMIGIFHTYHEDMQIAVGSLLMLKRRNHWTHADARNLSFTFGKLKKFSTAVCSQGVSTVPFWPKAAKV